MTKWTRSHTLALSMNSCSICHGLGLVHDLRTADLLKPCNCVFRTIFHLCYSQFRECAEHQNGPSTARLEYSPHSGTMQTYGYKQEEYCADFISLSRKSLTAEHWKVFKCHYLLGADWKLCCKKLNTERGPFFHAVYRIQQRLGRRFAEVEPYPLFPLDAYFGGSVRAYVAPCMLDLDADSAADSDDAAPGKGYVCVAGGD